MPSQQMWDYNQTVKVNISRRKSGEKGLLLGEQTQKK
jgi:hypothetical protein